MTLNDIRNAAAAYLHRAIADFTVNSVDLSLFALNQVRTAAELQNDFNFTRRLLQLTLDGVTGGSLSSATLVGTVGPNSGGGTEIKSIVDVGQFDDYNNLRPVEWTTVGASLDTQRKETGGFFRYPTDGQAVSGAGGGSRIVFEGDQAFLYPKGTAGQTYKIGIEAYTFTPDWVTGDFVSSPFPWGTKGSQYLMWGMVIHLNQVYKDFVFRQEGNLPPPQVLVDQGLQSLITWDIFKYEQSRRHNR